MGERKNVQCFNVNHLDLTTLKFDTDSYEIPKQYNLERPNRRFS